MHPEFHAVSFLTFLIDKYNDPQRVSQPLFVICAQSRKKGEYNRRLVRLQHERKNIKIKNNKFDTRIKHY